MSPDQASAVGPVGSPSLAGASICPFSRESLGGDIVFAPGSIAGLRELIVERGWSRVMLVVSAQDEPLVDRARSALGDLVALEWTEVRQHVPAELAGRATTAAAAADVGVVVTVGGGSTTGLGKAVTAATGLPLVAVPTTYAGSEMTPIYGLTAEGEKRTTRDLKVLPKVVVYDPELLFTLPPAVVGPSGMNALAHCVGALWAEKSDPLTDALALQGIRLLRNNLPRAYVAHGVGFLGGVQVGACIAGHALGTVGASTHHAICHLLGGMFDLPHAETHAVVLPYSVSFMLAADRRPAQDLAAAFGVDVPDLPDAIWRLGEEVGTPHGLDALGLTRQQAVAAAEASKERTFMSPGPLSPQRAEELLGAAWRGDPPTT